MRDPVSPEPSDSKTDERRKSERKLFSASGDVTEPSSKIAVSVRIADLGLHGCYADCLTVFPVGTTVRLSMRYSGRHFETLAKVVYSKPGMGMGLNFHLLSDAMHSMLREWLSAVKGDSEPQAESSRTASRVVAGETDGSPFAKRLSEKLILSRLIEMMMDKGRLTELEGRELLKVLHPDG
jgi:hypothetical protein